MRSESLIKAQNKYREENRDKINKQKLEKVLCKTCDCEIARSTIKRHGSSNKHKNNLKTKYNSNNDTSTKKTSKILAMVN